MWLSGCLTAVVCCALVCFSEVNAQNPTVLNETTGTIESDSFPYPMKTHDKLLWAFNIPSGNSVYLNLETVDLDESDTLLIFDGLINRTYAFSDVVKNKLYVLNPKNSTISVTISGNETKVNRRFRAYYTAQKDGDNVLYYSDDYMGLIKSPVYSVQNNIAKFSWVVTLQPGKTIYLAFKSLKLNKGGSLTIDDGSLKNFTGDVLPGDIATSTSNVKITVEFNMGEEGQGFELFYSHLYPNCSDHITLVDEQEKTVSFNVIGSEIPVQCFVVVEGPENTVLSAAVNWEELLMSSNPTDVILELGDGGSRFSPTILADSPSNRQPAPNVITKSNRLWIGYSYSSSNASVNASVIINVHNQGEDLVKSGSFGVKPTAANATLPSNTSAYILSVLPSEQVITYLSANTTLRGDSSISFYDGGKMEHLITKFASGDALYPVISTKNQMMIVAEHFGSNDSFQATFIAAPKGYNQLTTDRFGSYQVNGITNSSIHTWVIATPHNSTELIALNIAKAELSPELTLTIYEGPTNSSPVAFTLTNTSVKSSEIHISPGNGASITLQNNGIISTGLIADLSFQIQSACNFTHDFINSTETFVIKSPDFPSVYPSNARCEWHILSEKTLLFSFKSLNLPSTHPILIYSDNSSDPKLLVNVSGNGPIDDIFIAESHVVLKWSSVNPPDNLTVDKGFEIEVYPLDCSGTFDGSIKEFTTPNYPAVLKNSTSCVWFVNIPPKQGDKAEIVKLSYSSVSVKSSLAQLTVYEGGSLQSGTASNISSTAATDYLSRTNKLMIKYNYAADSVGGTPYSFKYDLFVCNQMCNNSICLHDSWRCNGINECGDFTDEAYCAAAPVIVQESSGVSVTSLVVAILLCLTLGAAGAIAVPLLWRRIRTHGRNYQEFRNSADA